MVGEAQTHIQGYPKKTEPILLLQKLSKIILILYTRTSGHVGEYYGPNFSCTDSTSYPEKKKG